MRSKKESPAVRSTHRQTPVKLQDGKVKEPLLSRKKSGRCCFDVCIHGFLPKTARLVSRDSYFTAGFPSFVCGCPPCTYREKARKEAEQEREQKQGTKRTHSHRSKHEEEEESKSENSSSEDLSSELVAVHTNSSPLK